MTTPGTASTSDARKRAAETAVRDVPAPTCHCGNTVPGDVEAARAEGAVAALRDAADDAETEAARVSSTGHLRAWWVIKRIRRRADALDGAR